MKTGDIATLLHVSENTVRNWAREYADLLSATSGGKPAGATREFGDADLYVLATVAEQRDIGLTHEQVKTVLSRGYRVTTLPQKPDPDVEAARQKVDLVPTQEVHLWMERVQNLQAELQRAIAIHQAEVQRLVDERDKALEEAKEERNARIEAEKIAARLESEARRADELNAQLQQASNGMQHMQRLIGQLQGENEQLKKKKRGLFGLGGNE